jgi:hypothetical protein
VLKVYACCFKPLSTLVLSVCLSWSYDPDNVDDSYICRNDFDDELLNLP